MKLISHLSHLSHSFHCSSLENTIFDFVVVRLRAQLILLWRRSRIQLVCRRGFKSSSASSSKSAKVQKCKISYDTRSDFYRFIRRPYVSQHLAPVSARGHQNFVRGEVRVMSRAVRAWISALLRIPPWRLKKGGWWWGLKHERPIGAHEGMRSIFGRCGCADCAV